MDIGPRSKALSTTLQQKMKVRNTIIFHSLKAVLCSHILLTYTTTANATATNNGASNSCSLKVATWNVASMQRGTKSEISKRLLHLQATVTFQNADVILLQEGISFLPEGIQNDMYLPGYERASACATEVLWETEPAYIRGGRHLQNSVFYNTDTLILLNSAANKISTAQKVVPRCVASAVIETRDGTGTQFTVASVHLTGGRYVDGRFEMFALNKMMEVSNALHLAQRPDIIGGDLNSYGSKDEVIMFQKEYEPFLHATAMGKQNAYLDWAIEGTTSFENNGYLRRGDNNKSTTYYGGTIDHIYLKNETTTGLKFCGATEVHGNFTYSDHRMVVTYFSYTAKTNDETENESPRSASAGNKLPLSFRMLSLLVIALISSK
mmetsp:Transcript_35395/g.42683  ORF Transcript_35395/g.42683 Transcript_35395/m.42683 type:complete len:380 (+) Transcript_35395:62-1201(+)